ncbi:MAG: phosphate ABC transporter permease PtsA [Mesorhizobium amorphae]|nr:MAG: phosphate ABC transporter permease PtsA [Mesorhizobium amorphae]
MTDLVSPGAVSPVRAAAKSRIAKRYAAERRFKWMGAGAVILAGLFLVALLSSVVTGAWPALRANYVTLEVDLSAAQIDPANVAGANFDTPIFDALAAAVPSATSRQDRRALRGLVSSGAGPLLKRDVLDGRVALGGTVTREVLLDDVSDLYFKGLIAGEGTRQQLSGNVQASGTTGDVTLSFPDNTVELAATNARASKNEAGELTLGSGQGSLLLEFNGGVIKLSSVGPGNVAAGTVLEEPSATAGEGVLRVLSTPEGNRRLNDRTIAMLDTLANQGRIESTFNTQFLFGTASREPELAGVWGAVVGSILTLAVTLALTFPIGVAAAIYLEEFAPKNRLTTFIEVNINNLAAVPSIVFGLLGLAVFLNAFSMPRSAPVVGGIVLALMTLPIIIIASRAALRAVPPSIREGALGVGASHVQTVFHHVLPLAMPGIMTGTILGMAHALGETAPLLMIGMVAFIVDVPGGFTDPATLLPVQIYMWADFPEQAFSHRTSAAILVLLLFLIVMNALAIILRKRFERRW